MTKKITLKQAETHRNELFSWDGKYDKPRPNPFLEFELKGTYGPQENQNAWANQLWHGEASSVASEILQKEQSYLGKDGKIKLIYIDPPFLTGSVRSLNIKTKSRDSVSYSDDLKLEDYLNLIYRNVTLMHQLLSTDGSFFIHCDWRATAYIRLICDEIFGVDNFFNEIIWKSSVSNSAKANMRFVKSHETILAYRKSDKFIWNDVYQDYSLNHEKIYRYKDDHGRYQLGPCDAPGGQGYIYSLGRGEKTPSRGYSMPYETALKWIESGILVVKEGAVPLKKWYLDERGISCNDVWHDIKHERGLIYATQKPLKLLQRIVQACSNENDIVADFFCGSGSTLVAAKSLNRRFIGADISFTAIHTARARLTQELAQPLAIYSSEKAELRVVSNKREQTIQKNKIISALAKIATIKPYLESKYTIDLLDQNKHNYQQLASLKLSDETKTSFLIAPNFDSAALLEVIRSHKTKTIIALQQNSDHIRMAKLIEASYKVEPDGLSITLSAPANLPDRYKFYTDISWLDYWEVRFFNLAQRNRSAQVCWQYSRIKKKDAALLASPKLMLASGRYDLTISYCDALGHGGQLNMKNIEVP